MPSLRYHAGRMVLYEEKPKKWRVKIKTKKEKLNFSLTATELELAIIEAEYIYADVRCMSRDHPLCIDCIHHLVIKAECGLGMPEGKASGGIWAKDCAYFWEKQI
tara:strand:- start:117 stop:431 length:315 start_codon:yes stop_codon:yes gene_type:complete